MPFADSWHIKARSHHCSVTNKPFSEGQPFLTALFTDPGSDGYLRLDFSEDGWGTRNEKEPQPFSFWRSVYRPPEAETRIEIVEKDDPEALLARLVEEDEAHTENARYILAVMLERRKLLIETDSQKTRSGLLRIYQHRHSGEIFIVKDPQIPLSEVAPLQAEVQQLLAPGETEAEPANGDSEGESSSGPESN